MADNKSPIVTGEYLIGLDEPLDGRALK